jgi:hypothetical protein
MVDLLTISETERVGLEGGGMTSGPAGVCRRSVEMGLSLFVGGAGGASPFKTGFSEDFVVEGGFLAFLLSFGDLEKERALRLSGLLLSADSDDLLPVVEPDPRLEVLDSEIARAGPSRLDLDASSS